MKLSELEEIAKEQIRELTPANVEVSQETILTLCATFREMLEILKCCEGHFDWHEGGPSGLSDAIKKAEEML